VLTPISCSCTPWYGRYGRLSATRSENARFHALRWVYLNTNYIVVARGVNNRYTFSTLLQNGHLVSKHLVSGGQDRSRANVVSS
jgi:hypothetical protein